MKYIYHLPTMRRVAEVKWANVNSRYDPELPWELVSDKGTLENLLLLAMLECDAVLAGVGERIDMLDAGNAVLVTDDWIHSYARLEE